MRPSHQCFPVPAAGVLLCTLLLIGCATNSAPRNAGQPAPTTSPTPGVEPAPSKREPSRGPASIVEPAPPRRHQERRDQARPGGPKDNELGVETAVAPPPTDEERLQESLDRLDKGNLAYNTPLTMKAGETAHIAARIGSSQVSTQTLEAGMPGEPSAKTETAATPVSTRMKMTLKSADFDITPLSSEEQSVGGTTPTTWEWDVVPKHAGQLRLHLAATVELKDLSRDFTTIDRAVTVTVDPVDAVSDFVQRNWQWLIATLTAIVGAGWKFFSSKRKPPPAP